MSVLHYNNHSLMIESVNLDNIANTVGTPVYVYSKSAILTHYQRYTNAFAAIPHRVCYAVKANSNLSILQLLAKAGAGFDVVSGGELNRVLRAGGEPSRIVFSGVGKSETEIETAITAQIACIDIESMAEFERISHIVERLQKSIAVAIRVNPNIDAKTHAHISTGLESNKFGIETTRVAELAQRIQQQSLVKLIGLAAHIGSQITELEPLIASAEHLLQLANTLNQQGCTITHINIGGGLGITYQDEQPPAIETYANEIISRFQSTPYQLIMEPGRAIIGNTGCLLTRVEYLKTTSQKNFAIVDAGMNDLIRPALYEAWQRILPTQLRNKEKINYDIAGPVCESADFLGKNRLLAIEAGDVLAIDSAGAYGFSMSSNYNTRTRPAEVLVDHDHFNIIRQRETLDDLFHLELTGMEPSHEFLTHS